MKKIRHISPKRSLLKALPVFLLLLMPVLSFAQDRFALLARELDQRSERIPGLKDSVDFSVSNASVQEFMRGIARAHNLNIAVSPEVEGKVVNNFNNAQVKDVLVFVCRQYNLDITFTGNIMAFGKYVKPVEVVAVNPRIPDVKYNTETDFLSMNLQRDTLDNVAAEITRLSLKNVIVSPEAQGVVFKSVFIQNRPFESALESMCYTEGLKVVKTRDNVYRIEKDPAAIAATANTTRPNNRTNTNPSNPTGDFSVTVKDNQFVTVDAQNTPLNDLIAGVSRELGKNYFLFSELQGNSTLYIENATYEEFLNFLLNGTKFTFKSNEGVYLVGERSMEGLRTTDLIQMENRTIESIIDYIPADLKEGVEIKEFVELNGLIVSGSYPKIEEIRAFMRTIDRVVPMVLVEVIIVDVNKGKSLKAGISAGLGDPPDNTTGTYNGSTGQTGGLNAELNAETINTLINSFNGYGLINLGNVSPDFYMNISALESDDYIKIRSTPRLSTLNGHEANLNIGKTEYYVEVNQTASLGSVNPVIQTANTYRSTNADLSISILPTVSSGEMVTLQIKVDQSDFVGTSPPGQPRDQFSRSFESSIRVHNGDMILLGGLENKEEGNTSDGLPFISRIPILKWLTGTTTKRKSKSELNIFIKATIIY